MTMYNFHDQDRITKEATREITEWLMRRRYIVNNVENLKEFQGQDIDLLISRFHPLVIREYKVEVKADTQYCTGNFFIETISNTNKNTPGWIEMTEADMIFYMFVPENILYILPVKEVRAWFQENKDDFRTVVSSTCGRNGELLYRSEGKLVRRKLLEEAFALQVERLH